MGFIGERKCQVGTVVIIVDVIYRDLVGVLDILGCVGWCRGGNDRRIVARVDRHAYVDSVGAAQAIIDLHDELVSTVVLGIRCVLHAGLEPGGRRAAGHPHIVYVPSAVAVVLRVGRIKHKLDL